MNLEIRVLTERHVNILDRDGGNERKTYMNSEKGRQSFKEDIPEPYKEAVLLIWGDEPTVSGDMENE